MALLREGAEQNRLTPKSGKVVGRIMRHPQAPGGTALVLDDNRAGATALGL
jgi:hypothetical protein